MPWWGILKISIWPSLSKQRKTHGQEKEELKLGLCLLCLHTHALHMSSHLHAKSLSCVWLFETPWTVAHQFPLPTGFPRQEYWSVWPCPPPGDLPNPGVEPVSLTSSALTGGFFNHCYHLGSPKPSHIDCHRLICHS